MNIKNSFVYLPLWWQEFVGYVLGLRNAASATLSMRQYEALGFINGLFLAGVIDSHEARRMRELVQNAYGYASGLEDFLARNAA